MIIIPALLSTSFTLTLALAAAIPSYPHRLPTPLNATYSVGSQIYKLVDEHRIDPFNSTEKRAVLISVFYPSVSQVNGACPPGTSVAPYMPTAVAAFMDTGLGLPDGLFESISTGTCVGAQARATEPGGKQRLILFDPGLGESRLIYQTMTISLAAQGYVVVAIDHPYDAQVMEYPDGRLVYGVDIDVTSLEAIRNITRIREQDIQFVLDEICSTPHLTGGLHVDCGTRRVGLFGHSLGGATAADITNYDKRVAGGSNLDGTFWPTQSGPYISPDAAFLLFAAQNHNATNDASFEDWWKTPEEHPAPRALATVQDTVHGSFTDYPTLLKVVGIPLSSIPGADTLIGTIDGYLITDILQSYLIAGFDLILKKKSTATTKALFAGQAFPEVKVVIEAE